MGGATMSPHPFTTIDHHVGHRLVPDPSSSYLKDDDWDHIGKLTTRCIGIVCTHRCNSCGRRLLPVILKDVACLVPGAYQGRRGINVWSI